MKKDIVIRMNNTYKIPLYNKDGEIIDFCLIDEEDYQCLEDYKFCRCKNNNRFYARTAIAQRKIYIHRLIFEHYKVNIKNKQIDHINHDGLDNRKSNIRIATHQQNGFNQKKQSRKCSSKYKGVTLSPNNRWYARIKHNQKYLCIGVFDTEYEAAIAYDIKAKEFFGEFASLNLPSVPIEDIENVKKILLNPKKRKYSKSKYLGIVKLKNKWFGQAYDTIKKKNFYVPRCFNDEKEAAIARNEYIKLNNLNAKLNIINE